MKNLTVNMPLAVPHQRPPSKYASHPYPVLIDDSALIRYSMSGLGYLLEASIDFILLGYSMDGEGELKGIYQELTVAPHMMNINYNMDGEGELRGIYQEYNPVPIQILVAYAMSGTVELRSILLPSNESNEKIKISYAMSGIGSLL